MVIAIQGEGSRRHFSVFERQSAETRIAERADLNAKSLYRALSAQGDVTPVLSSVWYGGMDVSDARRLKALEAENARLKRLLADAMLENEVTKEALRKKC
jgi:hypothetical protein